MRNTNKKGFTIVELVIVVAVIAILAAVLIPTFSGIIAKANLSADQVAVKNMNTVLATEFATVNPASIKEVVDALDENGFNVNSLTPLTKGYKFYWNEGTKTIVLVNENGAVVYPEKVELADAHKDLYEDGASYINVEVKNEEDLAAALANGNDITLINDIAVNSPLTVRGDVTINLNGKTLDGSARAKGRVFDMADGAKLTIDATGSTIKCGEYGLINITKDANVDIVINGGTYTADLNNGSFIKPRGNGNVNITLNNVVYTDISDDSYVISVVRDYSGTMTLNVNGGSYTADRGFQVYCTNGAKFDGVTLNTNGVAINAATDVEVKNCEFNIGEGGGGSTAIEADAPVAAIAISSGYTATVTGCTITTAGAPAYRVYSSGGTIIANGNNLSTYEIHKDTNNTYPNAEYLVKIDGTSYTE